MVLRQYLGAQHGHAGLVGRLDEVAEQDGTEPVVLHGVGDGDLGALGAVGVAFLAGVGDHVAVGAAGGDQAVAVLVVDVGGPADGAVEVREAAEEPQRDRLRRQALEERLDRSRILGPDRPHVHG
jgi:hypothetical protein